MKKIFYLFFCFVAYSASANNYFTPGTGVSWTLDDLVTNSGGDVSFSSGTFYVNDTIFISQNDTLTIATDATVKFAQNTYLDVNGTLIVNPPTKVTFTATDTTLRFLGMRIDSSNSTVLRKLTFEYANSLRLFDCSPLIDSCTFQYNNPLTTFGNGTLSLNRSNVVVKNSFFLNNQRSAIQGGANIANAPQILNCTFVGNNTLNTNVPQINLGASGSDTVRILNNQILRASTNSGGIGFLPVGDVHAIITGNTIRNNRYGLTFNGGANINAIVSYNVVDSNNTQDNPNLGGSGISFTGGSATSHQNVIVTGNIFRFNLWGITIQQRAMPNLGNLENADTTDDGKNYFINNTNGTTPNIDLYNNTVDNIMAQGNYWGSDDPVVVESHIFHKPDNATLGLVNYAGYITLPVQLINFNAAVNKTAVDLKWQTQSESNSDYFAVQKSIDGRTFETIGRVGAAGNSSVEKQYFFTDVHFSAPGVAYYRLQMFDKDGRFKYSQILSVRQKESKAESVRAYPTLLNHSNVLTVELTSKANQLVQLKMLNAEGKQVSVNNIKVQAGKNVFSLQVDRTMAKGIFYLLVSADGINQTIRMVKQ